MTNLRKQRASFLSFARKSAFAISLITIVAGGAAGQTNTSPFPSTGNVGIGTTTPASPLTIVQTGNSVNRILSLTNDSSGSSAQTAVSFFEGATEKFKFGMNGSGATGYVGGVNAFQFWHFQNAPIVFATNSSERMRIDGTGNVGIGTTAPSDLLQIDAPAGWALRLRYTGNNYYLRMSANQVSAYTAAGVGSDLLLNVDGGNVGIGTVSPRTRFDIKQASDTFIGGMHLRRASTNDTWALVTGADNSLYMGYANNVSGADAASDFTVYPLVLTSDGKVGIGTTTPGRRLEVLAPDGEAVRVYRNANTAGWGVNMVFAFNNSSGQQRDYAGVHGLIQTSTAGSEQGTLVFSTATAGTLTEKLRIDSAGNVGIGTTPGALYRLDVQGKVNSSELCIATDCKSSWSQVGGGGGPTSFSGITAGTNTVALLVGSGGSLGASGSGTINATTLGGSTFAAPGAIGATTPGTGAFSTVGINTAPSSYKLDVNGNTNVTGNITVAGTGNVTAAGTIEAGNIKAKYQDLAEWVPSSEQLAAGTVVVLDTTKSNQVISSTASYDTRVAGVISAQPGITLGEGGEGKVLVATTGRVRVKVDASRGAIQIGDLLVTSDIPGVAMKSEPVEFAGRKMHMPGTIIGKALEPLAKGSGEILVLLSLQ